VPQFALFIIPAATRRFNQAFLGRSPFASFFGAVTHPLAAPAPTKGENDALFVTLDPKPSTPYEKGLISSIKYT